MIKSGKYRHRVHIQERIDAQHPTTGVVTQTWETFGLDSDHPLDNVPAEILTGPGREMHAAGTKLAETTARINMRWFPGLREDMRILWLDSVYDIVSIEMDATARREYRIRVRDGASDGL
jgi:head-tail adaptor